MISLPVPIHRIDDVATSCAEGILRNAALLASLNDARAALTQQESVYDREAREGSLYVFQANSVADESPVIGTLKRSDLLKLYEVYFVGQKKPARRIYEAILNAAADRCPFCGGIGTPCNLDHYLPKGAFPQFAVLPLNLVPSCRDCNMDDKGVTFAQVAHDQVLHPYCDKAQFFTEQWISCEYRAQHLAEPGDFTYRCTPPATWDRVDAQRALRHFETFKLGHRYALKSAEILGPTLRFVRGMLEVSHPDAVAAHLHHSANEALFVNHWQAGMYRALSAWVATIRASAWVS